MRIVRDVPSCTAQQVQKQCSTSQAILPERLLGRRGFAFSGLKMRIGARVRQSDGGALLRKINRRIGIATRDLTVRLVNAVLRGRGFVAVCQVGFATLGGRFR